MADLPSDRRNCAHRSPLNYDRTHYATCALPVGHEGSHRQGVLVWTDRTMPYREHASLAADEEEAR